MSSTTMDVELVQSFAEAQTPENSAKLLGMLQTLRVNYQSVAAAEKKGPRKTVISSEFTESLKKILDKLEGPAKTEAVLVLSFGGAKVAPETLLSLLLDELKRFESLENSMVDLLLSEVCLVTTDSKLSWDKSFTNEQLSLLSTLGEQALATTDHVHRADKINTLFKQKIRSCKDAKATLAIIKFYLTGIACTTDKARLEMMTSLNSTFKHLRFFSDTTDITQLLQAEKTIAFLIDLIKSAATESEELLLQSLKLLQNVLAVDELNCSLFVKPDLLAVIVPYCENMDDEIVESTLWIISYLCTETTMKAIFEANVLSKVIPHLTCNSVDLQGAAARIVWDIATEGSTADIQTLIDAGVILPLSRIITRFKVESEDTFAVDLAVQIFIRMIETFADDESKAEAVKAKIVELGWKKVVGAIEGLRGSGEAALASNAYALLELL